MDPSFVTLLVADIPGMAGRPDDAAWAALREVADTHAGREVTSHEGGLVVTFPSAVAAVRCAIDMQRATTGTVGMPAVRIGLAAGEPIPGGGDRFGTPGVVARGLCATAVPGAIVTSEVVRQVAGPRLPGVLRPGGTLRLPGVLDRVAVAEVAWRPDGDDMGQADDTAARAGEITIVIADDQRLLRAGFRVILDAEPDMRVVGEAEDGEAAVAVVRRLRPDVVLMDIRMPVLDGLGAAERILSDPGVGTAVVMLTTFDRDEYVYEALRVGASGFLLKDTPTERLLDAVRVASAGEALIAPSITRRLVERFARASRAPAEGTPPALAALTARELDVLRQVARGLSNAEIAAAMVLGENTIKTHVAHILGKLGLRDRVQAVVLAYESGLVAPGAESAGQ